MVHALYGVLVLPCDANELAALPGGERYADETEKQIDQQQRNMPIRDDLPYASKVQVPVELLKYKMSAAYRQYAH